MTKFLVIDVEGPLSGSAFNPNHRLSLLGLYDGSVYHSFDLEHHGLPYGEKLPLIQRIVDSADVLIAFNSKYDLHWLRRYGIRFHHKKLWCLQYAEWCLSGQTGWPKIYPDLDTACKRRGLEGKDNYIWETYWSKKIPTDQIPWEELANYNRIDLRIEWDLFQAQRKELETKPQLKRLIWWGSQDLLVTEEMEWHGIKFNTELAARTGDQLLEESKAIEGQLAGVIGSDRVLWSSPSQVSAVLYGGVVTYDDREEYLFQYKDGRAALKSRKVEREISFPRLVEPLRESKTKKEGVWSTDEQTLRKIKAFGKAKQIIDLLLKKRELEKRVGTYYHGFVNTIREHCWEGDLLHSQLSHCRAASGRLASKNPNVQNLEDGMRQCIISRFPLNAPTV